MSKSSIQENIDRRGQQLLERTLIPELFDLNDFGSHDKTPDIDGYFRLKSETGERSSEFLFYQLKSTNEPESSSQYLKAELVKFVCETNIPVIIFVAHVRTETVYWHIIDSKAAKARKTKGYTIELKERITKDNLTHLHGYWRSRATKIDVGTGDSRIRELVSNHGEELRQIVGLLHVLMRGKRKTFSTVASAQLSITKAKVEFLLEELREKNLITLTSNYILLNDLNLGEESASLIETQERIQKLLASIDDPSDQLLLVRRISSIEMEWAPQVMRSFAKEVGAKAQAADRNTDKCHAIAVLSALGRSIPKEIIPLLRMFLKTPLGEVKKRKKGSWKNHDYKEPEDVVFDAASALSRLLLTDPSVLRDCWHLLSNSSGVVKQKLSSLFNDLVDYDIEIIRTVGFKPQQTVLSFLTGEVPPSSLIQELEVVTEVCERLVTPNFTSRTMRDWRTLTIGTGALPATEQLEELRTSVIELLCSLFLSTDKCASRERIIRALKDASIPSRFGKSSEKHRTMVLRNADKVLRFFELHLPSMVIREVYSVEKQLAEIDRFFGSQVLPRIDVVRRIIDENAEYRQIDALIGWDYLPEQPEKEQHEARVSSMLAEVTLTSAKTWASRLAMLATDREFIANEGYARLIDFVRRIGRDKPEVGRTWLNQPRLKLIFPSLLYGMDEAGDQPFLRKWIKANKDRYHEQIAEFFRMSNGGYRNFFDAVAKVGINKRNRHTIRYVLEALTFKCQSSRTDLRFALRLVTSLSTLGDPQWTFSFARRRYLQANSFTMRDARIIFSALVPVQRLEYHAIQIIRHIGALHPDLVLDLLMARVAHGIQRKLDWVEYDSVPYRLEGLEELLRLRSKKNLQALAELLVHKDPRYSFEAMGIIKDVFCGTAELREVLEELAARNTSKASRISSRLLRSVEDSDLRFRVSETLLASGKCRRDDFDELCYELATTEPPVDLSSWESSSNSLLNKAFGHVQKLRTEYQNRRREWELSKAGEEAVTGFDEHEELMRRGLMI